MAFPGPSGPPPSIPLSEKWELLKPHIKRLYIDEDRPLSEVIITMKRQFNFDSKLVGWNLSLYVALPLLEANCAHLPQRIFIQVLHQQKVENEEEHSCREEIGHG
jgi:hypothetical protein